MTKEIKLRVITIILYLVPIFLSTILTKKVSIFLLSTGFMTVLLGLSMKFMPSHIGYRKEIDKFNSSIFIAVSGILLILVAVFLN